MPIEIKNGIVQYFHCKTCLSKGDRDIIAVGWTRNGLQVWCDNCETNIVALDFLGQKVAIDIKPEEEKLKKNQNGKEN